MGPPPGIYAYDHVTINIGHLERRKLEDNLINFFPNVGTFLRQQKMEQHSIRGAREKHGADIRCNATEHRLHQA